jgi:hypothetical protein
MSTTGAAFHLGRFLFRLSHGGRQILRLYECTRISNSGSGLYLWHEPIRRQQDLIFIFMPDNCGLAVIVARI